MTTLTTEYVLSQIADVKYFYDDTLTICVLTTVSGFKLTGQSYVFDPLKYSRIIGMETAHKNAVDSLFELCAFHLKTSV